MPVDVWWSYARRAELVLGLLLAVVSFAPWWTRRTDGDGVSAWAGPGPLWFAVLLCLAVVTARSFLGLADRWAITGLAVALAVGLWGWLSELAGHDDALDDNSAQLAWVLHDQAADTGRATGPYDTAWGCPTGLALMALLLATLLTARLRNAH
ncbi:hypothetical protein ACQPZJ_29190 [Actinoplanes sp. CA-054009]